MYERTMIREEEKVARVITRPHKGGSAHEYRFHRHGDAWVLSRERDWYTTHALEYAERELDGEVLRRCVGGEQMTFRDFDDDGPSDRRRDVTAARAAE